MDKSTTSQELKKKFISFFESKGHKRIPNSSVIPENDPSALFINSGMHPIVPFLMGSPHPAGKRLVNYQRAVRTGDIEEVGVTKRHHTFFEMLGVWSLGDYWKKESLEWSMEFLVDILGLDPKRLYATVFRGNESVPRDNEAIEIWKEIFTKYSIEPTVGEAFDINGNSPRIVALTEEDNFWPKGRTNGPCGPCSEIYYDSGTGKDTDERYLEVGNNVFMSYRQHEDGTYTDLIQKNIDVGWGFERILSVLQNIDESGNVPQHASNYETDLFSEQKKIVFSNLVYSDMNPDELYQNDPEFRRTVRVILDHVRASAILISDGVFPSNKDQGYVLRRLIRRAVTFSKKYTQETAYFNELLASFIEQLGADEEYSQVREKKEIISNALSEESRRG